MNRCPITYMEIPDGLYHPKGFAKLNSALDWLYPLPLKYNEQIQKALNQMSKMAITGTDFKLNVQLSIVDSTFKIVDKNGSFILKPQLTQYPQVPENEDVTMRMAATAGIEVPLHGMVYAKDESLLYFIKRFDRKGKAGKIHVEDLAQVAGVYSDAKYDYSLEKVAVLLDTYCTFPMVEKMKLFKRVLFSWLIGNENMHLKNLSLIHRNNKVELSPAYDLVNTTILKAVPEQESALSIKGLRSDLNWDILMNYFAQDVLGLNDKVILKILKQLISVLPEWVRLIEISFLNEEKKEDYLSLLNRRFRILNRDRK